LNHLKHKGMNIW